MIRLFVLENPVAAVLHLLSSFGVRRSDRAEGHRGREMPRWMKLGRFDSILKSAKDERFIVSRISQRTVIFLLVTPVVLI